MLPTSPPPWLGPCFTVSLEGNSVPVCLGDQMTWVEEGWKWNEVRKEEDTDPETFPLLQSWTSLLPAEHQILEVGEFRFHAVSLQIWKFLKDTTHFVTFLFPNADIVGVLQIWTFIICKGEELSGFAELLGSKEPWSSSLWSWKGMPRSGLSFDDEKTEVVQWAAKAGTQVSPPQF